MSARVPVTIPVAIVGTLTAVALGAPSVQWQLLVLAAALSLALSPIRDLGIWLLVGAVALSPLLRRLLAGDQGYVPQDQLIFLSTIVMLSAVLWWPACPDRAGRTPDPRVRLAFGVLLVLTAGLGVFRGAGARPEVTLGLALEAGGLVVGYRAYTAGVVSRGAVVRAVASVAAVVNIYALVQHYAPWPWDLNWLAAVSPSFKSIGLPEPGRFRSFGTLESQLPFANFVALGLIATLRCRCPAPLKALLVALAAWNILLASVRTAFVALVLALVLEAWGRSGAARRVALALAVVVTAVLAPVLAALADPTRGGRFDLFAVASDTSVQARLSLLEGLTASGGLQVLGPGGSRSGSIVVDNGYLAYVLELTPVAAILVVALAWTAIRRSSGPPTGAAHVVALRQLALYFPIAELGSPIIQSSLGGIFWVSVALLLRGGEGLPTQPQSRAVGGEEPQAGEVQYPSRGTVKA